MNHNYHKQMAKILPKPETEDTLTYSEAETERLLAQADQERRQLHIQLGQYAGQIETFGQEDALRSQLRSILGLRSACFTWEVQEGKLVFFVTGYGHGVGLSQHGANQMARQGESYQDILAHYYTGVTVEAYPFTNMPLA